MDTKEIKTLCLKRVYGAILTEAEHGLVDDYAQTDDGAQFVPECRELKVLLKSVADVQIKPVDHEAMVRKFESTARQSFDKTVFRPWWKANGAFVALGLMAALLIALEGWSVINSLLLGSCVLWLITEYFKRGYYAKILSRPDLYEYARASRRRSDRILNNLPSRMLLTMFSGLAVAALAYGTSWGYQKYGIIAPSIVIFVLFDMVVIVAIVVYQTRKLKRSDPEVWDWWSEEIKE